MLHITERMVTLAKLGGKHKFAADIGTDHGYLAMHLVQSGLAEHVYAIDNKEGPASKARKNIAEENMSQHITCVVADGFDGLRNVENDKLPGAVFIAGIGGMVTADIVSRGIDVVSKIDRLVLQPANREDATREFLYNQGMAILEEKVIEDAGRYFVVFVVDPKGKREYPKGQFDMLYGEYIPKAQDDITIKYLERKLHFVKEALKELEISKGTGEIVAQMEAHKAWLENHLAH